MAIGSTFSVRGLGYLSYALVGAVTGASVTTLYIGGQQANLTWTLPVVTSPLASIEVEWNINGVYGAPTSYDPATTSVLNPITGGQLVGARIRCKSVGGNYSAYTVVAPIQSPPERSTNLTAVYGGSAGTASLTWTNAASITGSVLTRTIGASVTNTSLPASATSYLDTPGAGGLQVSYTITAFNSGGSAPASYPPVNYVTDPNPPTVTSFTAANPGNLTLAYTAPAQTNIASYDVALQSYVSGSWVAGPSTTGVTAASFAWSSVTHNTIYRSQVRAVDTLGKTSPWVTSASVTAINDTVGPVVTAPTVSVWNQTFTGFTVTRVATTDAGSSVASVLLDVSYDGGASLAESVTVDASAGTTNHTIPNGNRNQTVYYRLRATDSVGNVSTTSWVVKTPKPLGTFYVVATQTSTWETAGTPSWRTDTDDVVSGRLDSNYETQSGFWFYGTGVSNTCKGYTPDSGTVLVQRQGTSGLSGTVSIGTHASTTRPASAPAVSNIATGPDLTGSSNQVAYHTITPAQLTALKDGTAAGFASTDPGGYRRLAGLTSTSFSGMLTLVFN